MQYSFGLLKPDCLKRGLAKRVINEFKGSGLKIITSKLVVLTNNCVRIIWTPCTVQPFFPEMLKFSMSGQCLVFIVEGCDAIEVLNELVGPYDPDKGKGIRHRFGTSKMKNVIHSSKNREDFLKEALLFFKGL